MNVVRVPIGQRWPGGPTRLYLTPVEARALELPRLGCTLRIHLAGDLAAARWRAEVHQLDLPSEIPVDGVDAVLARDESHELSVQFEPARHLRKQRQGASVDPIRAAVLTGRYSGGQQLDLARDVTAHQLTVEYRSQRLDRPSTVGSTVDREALRSAPAGRAARLLLIGPRTPGIATVVRLALELTATGRCDRIYIAAPSAEVASWRRHLEHQSFLFPEHLHRGSISFVQFRRLPVWRPPARGRAILVVASAEQAHRRWGGRVAAAMRRAECAIALGPPGRDDLAPAWSEELAEELDAEVAPLCAPSNRAISVHRYPAVVEVPTNDVPTHLHAVVEQVVDLSRHQAHVDVIVTDGASRAVLRELLMREGLSLTDTGDGARPQVVLLEPGDQRPYVPAETTVHADLGAVRASPDLEGTNVFVVARGSSEDELASLLVGLDEAAQRFQVTTGEALGSAIALRWDQLAADILRGADPKPFLAAAPQAAHRSSRRRERLSGGGVPARAACAPSLRTDAGSERQHADLIARCLRQGEHELTTGAGRGSIRVVGTAASNTFPVGVVVTTDRAASHGVGAALAVDASPGSVIAEALFAEAREHRVSMDVPRLPQLADIPVALHAPRMRLIDRRYEAAGSAYVVGEYVSRVSGSISVQRRQFGDAAVRGYARREVPLSDDVGLPSEGVIASLLDRLADATEPDSELVTARFVAGDDVHLVERWSRNGAPDILVRSAVPPVGAPTYSDGAGGRIRVVDACDDGHLADEAALWSCSLCESERCASCSGGFEPVECALCRSCGCAGCVLEGLCGACSLPERAPELDREGLVGWRVPGIRCLVGRASVTLEHEGSGETVTYVPDADVEDELHIRSRSLALEHGLPLDTVLMLSPDPSLPPSRSLLSNARHGFEWRVVERPAPSWRTVGVAESLPEAGRGATVRPMSTIGLDRAWLAARQRPGRRRTGPVLCRLPFVERDELLLQPSGLKWQTSRFAGDGSSEVTGACEVPLQPPASPRDDHDGRLLGVAHVADAAIELRAVNASVALRVHRFGELFEWFAPGHRGAEHGTELAWHLLGRGYGAPQGTVLAAAREWGPHRVPGTFAEPRFATLVERSLTPRAALSPRTGEVRPLAASDLEMLGRRAAPRASSTLPRPESASLLELATSLGGSSSVWQVDVSFSVTEQWTGAGSRVVSFVVDGAGPALPPLDDTGEPGADFGVDSAGHLHQPMAAHSCEACGQTYCRVCPTETELAPCDGCRQPACGLCRGSRGGRRTLDDVACVRCGRAPCDDCGRRTDPLVCACCGRELCRWCVPAGSDVCQTCAVLEASHVPTLPAWIPTSGCRVTSASDADADVVAIVGAHRREVVLVREGAVVSWRSFHDDTRASCTAIAAARRWGRDYSILPVVSRSEPEVGGSGHRLWVQSETRLEVGPPSAPATVPFRDADELLDAVSLVVDDGGPYPCIVQEGGGTHLGTATSATPFPIRLRTTRTSVQLDRDGLSLSMEGGEWDGAAVISRGQWAEQPRRAGQGQRRHVATVGPVSCELRASGRDLELCLATPDGRSRYSILDDRTDLLAAELARRGGWRSDEPSLITSCVFPSSFQPLGISGAEFVRRSLLPVARAGVGTADLGADAVTRLAAEFEIPPSPERSGFDGAAREDLIARFSLEPTVLVALGLQVEETFAGGVTVEYRVWPADAGVTYEYEGRVVHQLVIDASGHIAEHVQRCRYCARSTCESCEGAVRRCAICAIEVCGRCAPTEGTRLCTACRRLSRAPLHSHRRLFLAPRPWQIMSGRDARHEVVVGRTKRGIRVVSRGSYSPPERGILPNEIGASFVTRAFEL